MIDTNGLCDKCHCGANANICTDKSGLFWVCCADDCGQSTTIQNRESDAIMQWNRDIREYLSSRRYTVKSLIDSLSGCRFYRVLDGDTKYICVCSIEKNAQMICDLLNAEDKKENSNV